EWKTLEQLTNLLASFAKATTLLEGSTYSTISFMSPAIKVFLQNCKPKLIDYNNDQNEIEIEDINFDDITTIFDNEEIVIDYDYNNEIEVTIDAKQIKVNQIIEIDSLVYKVKKALYTALKHYWKLLLVSSLIVTFLDPRYKRMDKFYKWEREQTIEAIQDLVQQHTNQLKIK
ncbi:23671_t:CDS:2, partial [Dentiscutata erythropus]